MKILMIGLGSIGQRHLRNIRGMMGDQVEILAYRVRGLKHTFTDRLEIREGVTLEDEYKLKLFNDLSLALAEKPMVAFITNITSEHIRCAIQAAQAGCHLFIEKPLSDSLDQVPELVETVERLNLKVFMGFQNRYHPALIKMKELLASGQIGNLMSASVEMGERLTTMHAYEDYRQTYMARKDQGGGVVSNQLIHEIDYISWMIGKPLSVYSYSGHFSNLEIDVEDVSDSLLTLNHYGRTIPVHLHGDFLQFPPVRKFKLIGDLGILEVDLIKNNLLLSRQNQVADQIQFPDFQRNNMFQSEIRDFFDAVTSGREVKIPLVDGIDSLKAALAIKKSSASGQAVIL